MFGWMSYRGKEAWQFLFWFFLFAYIPTIPAYFIMSLKGLLGLSALVYVALSWYVIYLLYNRFEISKNVEKSISN
jgi:hypothetical protein